MQHQIELKAMPSLLSLYRKIIFARKPGWDEQPLPSIQIKAANIQVSPSKVRHYAEVCGFTFDEALLPPTYLYVMVFRLHAAIFTDGLITFPLLGMIHLKNQITQYRPVQIHEALSFSCALTESRKTDIGLEFDLVSQVKVGDELVWESTSVYLYRMESKTRRTRPPKGEGLSFLAPQTWQLDEGLGRRYAKASGDYNLIHLHPFLSKRFGFERVLAHGMWSKARCVAALMPKAELRPFTIDVSFKLPLFMPNTVTFDTETNGDHVLFELRDQKGRRPHLTGSLQYL